MAEPAARWVLTVKPGLVDTPMTANVPRNALFASPDRVARDILRAVAARKDEIYTHWFWRIVMAMIRAVPERVFRRLRL